MNYLKVPVKVDELCAILQKKQKKMGTFREQYELSFNAHLNLVTIHPWVDGDGRTARLLMNYIQFCYHLFPTKIFKEDREAPKGDARWISNAVRLYLYGRVCHIFVINFKS